jgi:hypothetical protein
MRCFPPLPPPSPPPASNDHFIHAKVLGHLSEERVQEVVRSVVAKKFANLKDFMLRQQHQSRQSNYLNCKKACDVLFCLPYLSRAHVKNASFSSMFSNLSGWTVCLRLTTLLCCNKPWFMGHPVVNLPYLTTSVLNFF